jgi:hypothetical protein
LLTCSTTQVFLSMLGVQFLSLSSNWLLSLIRRNKHSKFAGLLWNRQSSRSGRIRSRLRRKNCIRCWCDSTALKLISVNLHQMESALIESQKKVCLNFQSLKEGILKSKMKAVSC